MDDIKNQANELAREIVLWDMKSAFDLQKKLHSLEKLIDQLNEMTNEDYDTCDFINLAKLNCAKQYQYWPVPCENDILYGDSSIIWTCDEKGYCLLGEQFETVKHVSELEI